MNLCLKGSRPFLATDSGPRPSPSSRCAVWSPPFTPSSTPTDGRFSPCPARAICPVTAQLDPQDPGHAPYRPDSGALARRGLDHPLSRLGPPGWRSPPEYGGLWRSHFLYAADGGLHCPPAKDAGDGAALREPLWQFRCGRSLWICGISLVALFVVDPIYQKVAIGAAIWFAVGLVLFALFAATASSSSRRGIRLLPGGKGRALEAGGLRPAGVWREDWVDDVLFYPQVNHK